MDDSLLQTSPSPIPEQARLPVAFPDSGGESTADNSSPESGEVRRGLNKVKKRLNSGQFASSDLPQPLLARPKDACMQELRRGIRGRGELTKYLGETELRGHLVMVILVKIDFGNAVICSLYINILIFIYSADF